MSDQTSPPPPPPAWGVPPEGPGGKPKKSTAKRNLITLGVVGGVAVLVVIGTLAGDGGSTTPTVPAPPVVRTEVPAVTQATDPSEGPMHAALGDTVIFKDSFGKHSADVTVSRKKVSTGDEFIKPDNGVYVGVYVKVEAFQDGISVPSFYALVGAKHFEQTYFAPSFEPILEAVATLNKGETAEGWLVFDVPSRKGSVVMKEFLSDMPEAMWTY